MNHLKEPIALCVHLLPKNAEKIDVLIMLIRCEEVLCCVLVGSSPFWIVEPPPHPPIAPITITSSYNLQI
jgi:hypothetical protein